MIVAIARPASQLPSLPFVQQPEGGATSRLTPFERNEYEEGDGMGKRRATSHFAFPSERDQDLGHRHPVALFTREWRRCVQSLVMTFGYH